mgnify:CR=1 FL=1
MTRYIGRINRVDAIHNNGDILGEIIPFLRRQSIPFKYESSTLFGGKIWFLSQSGLYKELPYDYYLVINHDVCEIKSSLEFHSTFEEDIDLHKHIAQLEAKLSTVMAEIDKLKATIKLERALTDNKITDAVIKARLGE